MNRAAKSVAIMSSAFWYRYKQYFLLETENIKYAKNTTTASFPIVCESAKFKTKLVPS